jgi:peptide/histidine transporter 3/4
LDKASIKPASWNGDQSRLPGSKEVCTVTQVEELKTVLQILPIWVTTIVAFTLYSQIGGVTQQESASLHRKWGPHFTFPTASAIVFLMITTIIFIPIYEFIVIPTLRKFTGHPRGLSLLKLMGIGLFLIMCAMIVAALVEQKRVNTIRNKNITVAQTFTGTWIPSNIYDPDQPYRVTHPPHCELKLVKSTSQI